MSVRRAPGNFDEGNGAPARARAPKKMLALLTATKDIDISKAAVFAKLALS